MTVNPVEDADLDKATIYHLDRMGWNLGRIARVVDLDSDTIKRILRDIHAGSVSAVSVAPLAIRLTKDARQLRVLLPSHTLPEPTAVILARIRAHCVRRHIDLTLTQETLEERLQTYVTGAWLTICEAIPPTPAIDERVRVLVPAMHGRSGPADDITTYPIRRGAELAVLEAGLPGAPGRDLLGREIPPGRLRRARLPVGENTVVSDEGTHLLAACDGVVVVRRSLLHVLPLRVHEGDLRAEDGVLKAEGCVIIMGTVREKAMIIAAWDVEVRGSVQDATIESVKGHITVRGMIGGTTLQPAVLRAGETSTSVRTRYTQSLSAETDIVAGSIVHHAELQATGDLYLPWEIERTLFDVQLSLGGGVIAPVASFATSPNAPTERRHPRASVVLPAYIALYGPPPLRFILCALEDISPGGVRCRIMTTLSAEPLTSQLPVQLKFVLPGHTDQAIVIARIVGIPAPDLLDIAFLQISLRHADQVTRWYLELSRRHETPDSGMPSDRSSSCRPIHP